MSYRSRPCCRLRSIAGNHRGSHSSYQEQARRRPARERDDTASLWSIPPITYCATDMPAFSAASGSFQVKSSFTSLVMVFVTVRLLPFFSTVTLIRSSTLIVSTFGARSYTDQRYWSIHSAVRTHSSDVSNGLTFASGSASGTFMAGSSGLALASRSGNAVLNSPLARVVSE